MVSTYGIRNIKEIAVDSGTLSQAAEFFAEHLVEIAREAPLLPMIVPKPYLQFAFASIPDGLGTESFAVIGEYLLIFRALEAKNPSIQKAGLSVIKACRAASYGVLDQYIKNLEEGGNDIPKYLRLTKDKVLEYVSVYQKKNAQNKKERARLNRDHDMNETQILRFAFFNRAMQTKQLADGFYATVSELIVDYAKEMEIINPVTTNYDALIIDSNVNRYKELANEVSINPSFLQSLFKVHCEYCFGYISILEEFILLLCFKNIPIEAWDSLCSKCMSDPRFPPGVYGEEPNKAIEISVHLWERKTLLGTTTSILDVQERIIHQRAQRMGQLPIDMKVEDSPIKDDSPRLYGDDVYTVPTLYQMKCYLEWICFLTQDDVVRSEEVASKDKLFTERAKQRIDAAHDQGRKVILHKPDGSTMEAVPKKRSSRDE